MYVFRPDAWANGRPVQTTPQRLTGTPGRGLHGHSSQTSGSGAEVRRKLQVREEAAPPSKSHDAGTIDRQTYLQLVRETFDAQVDL